MSGGYFTDNNLNNISYTLEDISKSKTINLSTEMKDYMVILHEQVEILNNVIHHVDYLLSGDIDENEFKERLANESKKIDIAQLTKSMNKCSYCGHYFFPKRKGQKHCSASCRVLYAKKNNKEDQ